MIESIGPMFSGKDTEKLKQGFAFSYKQNKIVFD
jgi:hypothetical protein|tara:strand:- start:4855 stop:4956 length:102 start_codon:yes stop_codon:yes gene_type:complete